VVREHITLVAAQPQCRVEYTKTTPIADEGVSPDILGISMVSSVKNPAALVRRRLIALEGALTTVRPLTEFEPWLHWRDDWAND
jgi:hypothetical protein